MQIFKLGLASIRSLFRSLPATTAPAAQPVVYEPPVSLTERLERSLNTFFDTQWARWGHDRLDSVHVKKIGEMIVARLKFEELSNAIDVAVTPSATKWRLAIAGNGWRTDLMAYYVEKADWVIRQQLHLQLINHEPLPVSRTALVLPFAPHQKKTAG